MIYNGRVTPPNHWPPLIRHPRYYPDRRLSGLWFLILAIVVLLLSVIALIIVFAVEHSWFHDSFENSLTRYGLWRLCFFENTTCVSWFAPGETYSAKVERRLSISRVGINAWQALEIIFLFLTTATLFIAIVSLIFYRLRNGLHYYTAILASFCVWPAATIGVSVLFVFGFAVFNVSPATPSRDLDWCFYVNLVAVILVLLAAILLSIYDALLKKPIKNLDDDTVIETFADLNGYPAALSPSTFVIVRRNKNKRHKPYSYPQVLYPNHYFPTTDKIIVNENPNFELRANPNHQLSSPYVSNVITHEINTTKTITNPQQQSEQQRHLPSPPPLPPVTPYRGFDYNRSNLITSPSVTTMPPQPPISIQTRSFRAPLTTYQSQSNISPPQWRRAGTNTINQTLSYVTEPTNDYTQHNFYFPNRSNRIERTFEKKQEPRLLHYYTGYDYFATVDPSDTVLTRHHPPITGLGSAIRYGGNSPYQQDDYIKSTL